MSTPSLLNIPYLYKAGTLYSQIPESGAGDFTVTRTTTVANRSTRINKDGLIELVANNVPRLDYPVGGAVNGCPALLVEPSATNSMFYSQSINSWPTKTGLTITDNNAISPDGTQNASYIQQTIGGATVSLVSAVVTVATAQPQSVSFYAKAGQVTSVTLQLGTPALWVGSTRVRFTIDLLTGVITIITGTGTASSVAVGNGWYKYSVVTAATIGSGTTTIQTATGAIFSPNSGDGFYLWGAQWEQNSLAPTSYIPTTTAAVTRSEDQITRPGVSSLIGQTEGTFYFEGEAEFVSADLPMINRGVTNSIMFYRNPSNRLAVAVYYGGANFVLTTSTAITGPFKMAIAYKQGSPGDTALFVNGVQAGTTNTANWAFTAALTEVVVRSEGWVGGTKPYKVRGLGVYPNRIPNTAAPGVLSLATLTTP